MRNGIERRKTEKHFWIRTHETPIRFRLPSPLNIGTSNTLRLLRRCVPLGSRVLEIGFAPGKILAYLVSRCSAIVSGVDYSETGVATARKLFDHLGLAGDLRCEDFFASTFPKQSFDFVYSLGFVEHFDNASTVVERHFQYLAPGGRALIAIPNYGGIYGKLQSVLDPENLDIHNLQIMRHEALLGLAKGLAVSTVKTYAFGRVNPGLLSFHRKLPRLASTGVQLAGNLIGLLQPIDIAALCPLLVLEFTRERA